MDDPLVVRGLHHLADAFEQRQEALERDGPLHPEQRVERSAAHVLHRDPQEAVGFGAERVGVGCVRVIEQRGQTRLAQEPLDRGVVALVVLVQDLDHRLARQPFLFGEEDQPVAAAGQGFADDELAERAADQRLRALRPDPHAVASLSFSPLT